MALVNRTDPDRQLGPPFSGAAAALTAPFDRPKTDAPSEFATVASGPGDPMHEVAEPVIVALVCSAGGLKALTAVLASLPPAFPASVIVLQHHRPGRPNVLPRLLGRHCELPVSPALDGEVLRPARVMVVPPGKHALVTPDNTLALVATDGSPPYRPSADLLLTSLALVAPSRSIAVILSGMGSDGATGASALHHMGGLVVASDRASSEYFDMPAAAISRDETVDYVIPLDTIAAKLVGLVRPLAGTAKVAIPRSPVEAAPAFPAG